jgi:subtilisin family serine protease
VKNRNEVLASLLAFLLVFAAPVSRVASAQDQQTPTEQAASSQDAFDAKADKLLKHAYRAATSFKSAAGQTRVAAAREVDSLSRVTGVSRSAAGGVSVRLLVQLGAGGAEELKSAGFGVGSVVGDIATVLTDAGRLPELAALASVKRMWATTYRRPVNDLARQSVGIDNLSGQRVVSQTGAGVVVGLVDTGIDFRHADFTVPGSGGKQTRIKFLLDMTVYNSKTVTIGGQDFEIDPSWNYTLPGGSVPIGKLYNSSDINAALAVAKPTQSADPVMQRDKNGHGTHVAGIAAGNGLAAPSAPGVYSGMAPAADLIVVKASRENDGTDSFGTDDEVNALQFIKTQAGALNEPFVANLSLGGQAGPHDGTGPDEVAIDNIVKGGPGRAICVAAGNEGSDSIHAQTTVPANGSIQLHFNATKNPNFIDLYSTPRGTSTSGRYSVTLTEPDGKTLGPINFDVNGFAQQNGQASDASVQLWDALDDKGDSDPSNDQADVFMLFQDGAKTGTWTITLTNGAGEPASTFDAWSDGDTVSFSDFVDNNSHLVGSPGTSHGAITVGAYVTRSGSQTIGDFAFFTSPGPTADGRQKPEISAPGYILYSSKSSDIDPTNGITFTNVTSPSNFANVDTTHYGGLAGTSMSTPVVTGSVALMLQANRNLTNTDVKTLIESNSAHDQFDATGWNPRFGFGKLSVPGAISGGVTSQTNLIDDPTFYVSEHYLDFLSRTPDASGLQFWTNNITSCGADANCLAVKRVDTSAAFFLSIEFQQTGYLVYKMYKASFGNLPGKPVPIQHSSFIADTQTVVSTPAQVIVGVGNWQQQLQTNEQAFALAFVQRPQFVTVYPTTKTPAQFVAALYANAGVTPSASDTSTATGEFGSASDTSDASARARALLDVAQNTAFSNAEFNRAFVLMQYFGYLQRDPDAAPDSDFSGYNFWLSKLNQFGGNYVNAEMVKAFITATEYRQRFGS